MRPFFVAVGAALLLSNVQIAPARACGFKAGGAIGVVRFDQLHHTGYPVNILIYANPKSDDAKKTLSPTLETVLAKVGHAVSRTESKEEFLKLAQQGWFPCEEHGRHNIQVVIADLPDAEMVYSANGPAVIPIVSKPAEFAAPMRTKYPNVLTPSARPSSHLPAIESVARVAHNKKGAAPILVAADVRAKSVGSEDRAAIATAEERKATGTKEDRAPIAAGGTEEKTDRGGVLAAGAGDQQKEQKAASGEEATPVAVGAKTDNVASTQKMPDEPERKETAAASDTKDEPKAETKAERAAREKAEKKAKLEQEKAEKKARAEQEKADRLAALERAKQDKAEAAERRKQEQAERAEKAKAERASKKDAGADRAEEKPGGVKNEIYFARARYRVDDAAAAKLGRYVRWLKDNPSATAKLEGHADRSGGSDLNMHISQMRAESVKKFLVSKGIAENRLETVGLGEEHPVDPPGDSWRNRCVVFVAPGVE